MNSLLLYIAKQNFISMRRYYPVILLIVTGLLSCSDGHKYDNPNLLNTRVNFEVNLALPQFSDLQFPMNPVYVNDGGSNGGVIIANIGSGNYVAFDAADPNEPCSSDYHCCILEIKGLEGISPCETHNTYNLVSGTPVESKSGGEDLEFALKPYRVVVLGGNRLQIRN